MFHLVPNIKKIMNYNNNIILVLSDHNIINVIK